LAESHRCRMPVPAIFLNQWQRSGSSGTLAFDQCSATKHTSRCSSLKSEGLVNISDAPSYITIAHLAESGNERIGLTPFSLQHVSQFD